MIQFKKVAFHTLGCKLNFAETSTIARLFSNKGIARVNIDENPDIFIINTCSVTENADKKCRHIINKAKKINPDSFIALIGCYAQLKPEVISKIEGVDLVLGANEKFDLLKYISDNEKVKIKAGKIRDVNGFIPSYSIDERTRSFVKIQDGCNYFCSFCTIPLARGKSRSNNIAQALKIVNKIATTEVKEIILTGINIGDFGKGYGESFLDLITKLDDVEGIERFRISSIEPNLLSDEIISFVAKSKRFVPHFHIPLQCGNDYLLKKMRRKYSTSHFANRINTIKKLMPDACIGVDVITGFPQETTKRFIESYNFINNLDISYLHVFTYSERANTLADRMEESIPIAIRHERSNQLRNLSDKKKRAFYQKHVNTERSVLFESPDEYGSITGFTDNYIKVVIQGNSELHNALLKTLLCDIDSSGKMSGKIINNTTVTI